MMGLSRTARGTLIRVERGWEPPAIISDQADVGHASVAESVGWIPAWKSSYSHVSASRLAVIRFCEAAQISLKCANRHLINIMKAMTRSKWLQSCVDGDELSLKATASFSVSEDRRCNISKSCMGPFFYPLIKFCSGLRCRRKKNPKQLFISLNLTALCEQSSSMAWQLLWQ